MARDVIRLLDHLKIQKAHLVGYSLGAVIGGRLVTLNPDRLASVAFVGRGPIRELTGADKKFAEDSIAEMESDLPFRSLAVAVQPVGQPLPSDDELRKLVAPLVAANDIKAFAAMWRGGAFLIAHNQALKKARPEREGRRAAPEGSSADQDADRRRRDPRWERQHPDARRNDQGATRAVGKRALT